VIAVGCYVDVDDYASGSRKRVGESCAAANDCESTLVCRDALCALPASCRELKEQQPGAKTQRYLLQFDKLGLEAPTDTVCDMVNEGGGWMLVWRDAIGEMSANTTSVMEDDENGGVVLTVYANGTGCGVDGPPAHTFFVDDVMQSPWTEIRFKQLFVGRAPVYSIFGDAEHVYYGSPGLVPFEPGVDFIRDEVAMGPTGDTFNGQIRGTGAADSFWHEPTNNNLPSSAVVTLRRRDVTKPAGAGTGVMCNPAGEGTTSPTWWRYESVFVR
jgi:hypothetical protein